MEALANACKKGKNLHAPPCAGRRTDQMRTWEPVSEMGDKQNNLINEVV